MKKILTVGVYDYFHLGHLRLFKNAKKLGDYLIVAVQDGDYILRYKPDAKVLYSTEERMEIIRDLRSVDEVIIYKEVDKIVQKVNFDVFAIGEDQVHEGFQRAVKWCEEMVKRWFVYKEHRRFVHRISKIVWIKNRNTKERYEGKQSCQIYNMVYALQLYSCGNQFYSYSDFYKIDVTGGLWII